MSPDMKDGNTAAMVSCKPIAVVRQPLLECLTVPLKGVSVSARKPFKLPGGVKPTEGGDELRKKKTLGARLALCRWVVWGGGVGWLGRFFFL